MRKPRVDDLVRLTQDVPELLLHRGDVGIVRSTWFAPTLAYEVEFHPAEMSCQTRALLLAEQMEIEDRPLVGDGAPIDGDMTSDASELAQPG